MIKIKAKKTFPGFTLGCQADSRERDTWLFWGLPAPERRVTLQSVAGPDETG